jgi:hypothetical protein
MNSGFVAVTVTVVLAATTFFPSVLRVSDEITRDGVDRRTRRRHHHR